ncbi:MAG: serine hydrolase domain-containing protein [Verrucomicrobiia bacterium]
MKKHAISFLSFSSLLSLAVWLALSQTPASAASPVSRDDGNTGPAAQAAKPGVRDQLTADTPRTTPDGASFVAPAGWWIETRGKAVILSPEGNSRVGLVDVHEQDADTAVKKAWVAIGPELKWALKLTTDSPGREGWDSFRNYSYEVSPNEHRTVGAFAAKRGDAFTVVVYDLDRAVAEKRGGQTAVIFDRLQAPGFSRESFAGKKAKPLDSERIGQLTAFVEKAMEALGIPGVALSVYQEGKIVFEGGLGVREQGQTTPVDAETLFMVASNTKSMTTLLLATLVDEGKFTWDTPVIAVMPDFKLGDAETTRQVLIKHLVCACTGLPRQDYEWLLEFDKATPASEMALLATFQPTSKFGELFQYSNLLAAAGGFVAAHVLFPGRELGEAYDAAMAQRVFGPLGMTSTTFDFNRALAANHASPHSWNVDAVTTAVEMGINYAVVPLRPAGGAWSNVRDMMHYLRMELVRGVSPDGQRVASEANVVKRREQQIKIGNDASYGMGLEVNREWSIPVVHHGGSLVGYKSDMFYLPDHDVAAVILANSDEGGVLLRPFGRRLLEVLFDGKPEAEQIVLASAKNRKAARLKERTRLTVPADPTVVANLAARYRNASLGEIAVLRDGLETWFDFGEWKSAVASRNNDDGTVGLITIAPGITGLPAVVGRTEGLRTLTLRDGQHKYVFTEVQ